MRRLDSAWILTAGLSTRYQIRNFAFDFLAKFPRAFTGANCPAKGNHCALIDHVMDSRGAPAAYRADYFLSVQLGPVILSVQATQIFAW